ncbi:MAG: tRNA-dihydrouridine synthase family protein [Treponemataceae bacterium]
MPEKKLIFAPMATLSHEAMRRTIYNFGGCDEYYCEMINASSLLAGGQFEKYYVMSGPEPEKMVWQLTDSEPEPLIKAAKMVSSLGGIGIDINMGCPAPDIYKHGSGMAWMNKDICKTGAMLEKIAAILQNSEKNSIQKRLSIKCRLGEDSDFENEKVALKKFFDFISMLVSSGVKQIVLHPRTKKQKYSRPAKWNYVQELCERLKDNPNISVIGNGDIFDIQSASQALNIAPDCKGIMIGRAAIQKPWIFYQIKKNFIQNNCTADCHEDNISKNIATENIIKIDLLELAITFMNDIREFQPQEFWKTRTQRFFSYFSLNFSFAHYLKTQLINSKDHFEQERILSEYLKKMPLERYITV